MKTSDRKTTPTDFLGVALTTRPATWWVLHHPTTQRLSPLRGSKRLHQLSKRGADSREFWGLAGSQPLGEFTKDDADLRLSGSKREFGGEGEYGAAR